MFKLFYMFLTCSHLRLSLMGDEPGGQTAPEPVDPPPAADTAPAFDGSQYAYTFRGEQVTPASHAELIDGLQLGHSYRVNRDKFEQDRTDLTAQQQQYKQYADLHTELEANPSLRDGITNLYNQHTQGQSAAPQTDPAVTALQQQFQSIQDTNADKELQGELNDLEGKFPDVDFKKDTGEGNLRNQLIKFMSDNGIVNPLQAFKAFHFDTATATAKFNGASQTTQQQAAANRQGFVGTGNQVPAAPVAKRPGNYSEAFDAIMAERSAS